MKVIFGLLVVSLFSANSFARDFENCVQRKRVVTVYMPLFAGKTSFDHQPTASERAELKANAREELLAVIGEYRLTSPRIFEVGSNCEKSLERGAQPGSYTCYYEGAGAGVQTYWDCE